MSASAGPVSLPAPPLRERRWLPVLGLALVMVAVVSGGYVASDAIGQAQGDVVAVGSTVRVHPPPGWELAGRFEDPTRIRLTSGSTSLDVATLPFPGSEEDLLAVYVEQALEPEAEQFEAGRIEPFELASGLSGSRIPYVGLFGDVQAPVEGEVTAVVSPSGVGVIFDGWAPAGQLRFELDDIDAMIASAEVV